MRAAQHAVNEPARMIKERIAVMLAMRRARRRRVQIPLFVAAALLFATGITIAFISSFSSAIKLDESWGFAPIFAGAASIALAAMPGDVLLLRSLLCAVAIVSLTVMLLEAPMDVAMLRHISGPMCGYIQQWTAEKQVKLVAQGVGATLTSLVAAPLSALGALCLLVCSFTYKLSSLRLPVLVVRLVSSISAVMGIAFGFLTLAMALSTRAFDECDAHFMPAGFASRIESACAFGWMSAQCLTIGLIGLFKRDLCARVHGYLSMRGVGVDAAAGIAELLDGVKASHILEQAASSFRAIPFDQLTAECFARPPSDAASKEPSAASQPAAAVNPTPISAAVLLGHADAFVSHSWHDPAEAKWAALCAWGIQFRAKHGRAPLLWIDQHCIQQDNIAAQLQSLPVYLAGCQRLVVLHGPTYLQRLWCVVELFVFFHAHLPAPPAEKIEFLTLDTLWAESSIPVRPWRRDDRVGPTALRPQLAAADSGAVHAAESFDLRAASETLARDEERLSALIEGCSEAPEHFNRWIRALVLSKLKVDRPVLHKPREIRATDVTRGCRATTSGATSSSGADTHTSGFR